jgi:ketosteroid isomerase-like protein
MTGMGTASVDDQKGAIKQWAAAWSTHDMERLLPLFTEDVIYEDVTMGVGEPGRRRTPGLWRRVFVGLS